MFEWKTSRTRPSTLPVVTRSTDLGTFLADPVAAPPFCYRHYAGLDADGQCPDCVNDLVATFLAERDDPTFDYASNV